MHKKTGWDGVRSPLLQAFLQRGVGSAKAIGMGGVTYNGATICPTCPDCSDWRQV